MKREDFEKEARPKGCASFDEFGIADDRYGSDVPDQIHGSPGESGAEGGEDQLVALLEPVLVFVKAERN